MDSRDASTPREDGAIFFGQAVHIYWEEQGRRLGRALDTLDAALCSLHDEGCDLSVTAAQQREANAAGLPRSHWWWRLEAPAYVSGGNPLIAPLPAEAALAGD